MAKIELSEYQNEILTYVATETNSTYENLETFMGQIVADFVYGPINGIGVRPAIRLIFDADTVVRILIGEVGTRVGFIESGAEVRIYNLPAEMIQDMLATVLGL